MAVLTGLHGAIAIVLLCGLLFAEEAGIPLPFAPGELTLIAGGLLVASGGLNPFVFVPCAFAACVGGSLVGYSWSRLVGEHALRGIAARLHQQQRLERVAARVRAGGARSIAISRSILGLRIYTTLVAGAAGVPLPTFLLGAAPATAVWVVLFVVLGAIVGIPVEHFLSSVERLAAQGLILVAIGVGGYIAVRKRPPETQGALMRVPYALRIAFAVLLDIGIVASIVAGVLSVARTIAGVDLTANWADLAIVAGVMVVFYLVITRRGTGATVGETLFDAEYVRRLRQLSPLTHTMAPDVETTNAGSPAAQMFHALGDEHRLMVARALEGGGASLDDVSGRTGLSPTDALAHLGALQRGGAVRIEQLQSGPRYVLEDSAVRALQSVDNSGQSRLAAAGAP